MEDLPVENEEDKKQGKKRKKLSFLDSWRRLNRTTETEEKVAQPEEAKKPFSNRTWESFKEFFSDIIKPPEALSDEKQNESKATQVDSVDAVPLFEVPVDDTSETVKPPKPEEISEPIHAEKISDRQPEEGGELFIDHSQENETNLELPRPVSLSSYETHPPVPIIEQQPLEGASEQMVAGSGQPEAIGAIVDRMEKETDGKFTTEKNRNRRRQKRLKREVIKLKKDAKEVHKEQKTLKQEQADVQEQIDNVMNRPVLEKLITQQQRERTNLQENRGLAPLRPEKPPVVEQPKQPLVVERPVAAETRPAVPYETKERIQPPLTRQLEVLPVEDTRSEREFERRHEVKDQSASAGTAMYAAMATAEAARRSASAQMAQASRSDYNQPQYQPPLPQSPRVALDSPMYRQAVRGGFVTAILLLAIWLVIYMVH